MIGNQKKYGKNDGRLAYIDLFSGPGIYKDGTKSTPILILEKIINSPELSERMVTIFNDKNSEYIEILRDAVNKIDGIEKLRYKPIFASDEVGERLANLFQQKNLIPTLFFVDPCGYKGLSVNLISSIIKDKGCDCLFFFNYNRINMGINNKSVEQHMVALFGRNMWQEVKRKIDGESPENREIIIVEAICNAIQNNGIKFVLPFRFKGENGKRTSHYIIFVSKHFRGYETMKDIMYRECIEKVDGVASFEYIPGNSMGKQGMLFDLSERPLETLKDMLITEYAGRTINFQDLYEEHCVDKPFVRSNYQTVFKDLLNEGKIIAVNRETGKPPRGGTFSVKMRITFLG
jgi:three-Cys-motif partner protein